MRWLLIDLPAVGSGCLFNRRKVRVRGQTLPPRGDLGTTHESIGRGRFPHPNDAAHLPPPAARGAVMLFTL
jgi:hypothetical protein